MRRSMFCAALFHAALITSFCVGEAAAQRPAALSLDLSVERGLGSTTGTYIDNSSGITGDLLLTARIGRSRTDGLVVGVGAGIQGVGPTTSVCIADQMGGCVQTFPQFTVFSTMLGWENSGGTVRALAGPAVVHADATAAAGALRADLALPVFGPVWLTAGGQAVYVPGYAGDAFRLGGISFGVRVR